MASVLSLDVIKKRPILTSGIIIGGGLLMYFVFMRGGGESTSPARMGYADTQVMAGSELVALNNQQYAQGQQIQGQLAAIQIEAGNELAIANLNANLQRDLAALSLQAAQGQNAAELAAMGAQYDIQLATMNRSADIEEMRIESELLALQGNNNRDLAIQQMLTQAQVNITGMATQVQLAGISSQEKLGRATIDANVAMTGNMLNLQAVFAEQETRREQARIDRDIVNIRESNKTARNASDNAMIGDIASMAGTAMMFMSSIHIKSIDGIVDCGRCLNAIKSAPLDFWRYLEDGENAQHLGTYSQDFYREIGAKDWDKRDRIHVVDYMGALTGAIKALAKEH